jgi:hypothetical protein
MAHALSGNSRNFSKKYTAGNTIIDSSGAVIMPPIMGAAIRSMTSLPAPDPKQRGRSPATITAAVIAFEALLSSASLFTHANVRLPPRIDASLRRVMYDESPALPHDRMTIGLNTDRELGRQAWSALLVQPFRKTAKSALR